MVVLVVDDEELVRGAVGNILQAAGHDVLLAGSVNEARRIWWRETQAKELRLSWPDVPVLFMSGAYMEHDIVVEHHLGDDRAFIPKPFGERKLIAKIEDLCAGRLAFAAAS
jgi:DNA-binding response OmpR family regulator